MLQGESGVYELGAKFATFNFAGEEGIAAVFLGICTMLGKHQPCLPFIR